MFPGIADPGADRVLLFAGIAPIAAVPSNGAQVLVRVFYGRKRENYGVNYCEAQQPITMEVPETFDARTRAYLLVPQHGQEICKRTNRAKTGFPQITLRTGGVGRRDLLGHEYTQSWDGQVPPAGRSLDA